MTDTTTQATFDILDGHKFMNLTTFYADGRPRTTPVWFAREGDSLFVLTNADAYKVKRLNQTGRATVQPSDASGKALDGGPIAEATGVVHDKDSERGKLANEVLNKKYGITKRLFDLMGKLRGGSRAYIELHEAG